MESDRDATLIVRAAARGVVDFSRARVLDPRWWRRTRALVRAMVLDDDLLTLNTILDYQCALVGNPSLTDESYKKAQDTIKSLMADIVNARRPWEAKTVEEVRQTGLKGLVDLYKKYVGDPADPAFRDKLRRDLEAMDTRVDAGPPETDEQRIERLARDRKVLYTR